MMLLSKESINKDQQLKKQMLVSFQDVKSKGTEKVWQESGFFDERRGGLTISKANFPENTFVYASQAPVSTVKGGERAIYVEFVVLAQLIPIANPDPSINLDTYEFKENETLLYMFVYNKATGLCSGLTKKLARITLRGEVNERFYSYGYSKENSSVLYCTMKHPLPNVFHCTTFKKRHGDLLNENQNKQKLSKMYLYLPSTLDRKEKFMQ